MEKEHGEGSGSWGYAWLISGSKEIKKTYFHEATISCTMCPYCETMI